MTGKIAVEKTKGGICAYPIPHFHPRHTFLCGQCFRWNEEDDGSFTGVAHGKVLNLSLENEKLLIKNTNPADFNALWRGYLDLDRDYGAIKQKLSKDDLLAKAVSHGWGIHILRQDIWECLISFIISANNNIPRIKGIIEGLCKMLGDRISWGKKDYFTFPDSLAVSSLSESEISSLRAGYRGKYIIGAAKMYARGDIDLNLIKNAPLSEARRHLCSIPGVGPKVADCVLLFGAGRFGAFPSDVWVKRVMEEFYGCPRDMAAAAGEERFGGLSGFAQQYLFYWRKENKGL